MPVTLMRSAICFCALATSPNRKCYAFLKSNSLDRSRLFREVSPHQFSNEAHSEVFHISDKKGLEWIRYIGRRGLPQSNTLIGLPIKERLLIFLRRFTTEVISFGVTLSLLQFIPTINSLFVRTSSRSFICNNLLRWSIASIILRVVLLHSEIASSNPSISRGESDDWFLSGSYFATSEETATPVPVIIRQVPGNGSCMFLAVAAGILHNESSSDDVKQHPSMSEVDKLSRELRSRAVDILSDAIQKDLQLIVEENESICASQLVELAAAKYGITTEDYLKQMRKPGVWGGGPELVALANQGSCQIVLLEKEKNTTHLKVSTRFGPAAQNSAKPPIYVLSANNNFPDTINETKHNHFLAVFPAFELK